MLAAAHLKTNRAMDTLGKKPDSAPLPMALFQ
jgi:hypothetical protein